MKKALIFLLAFLILVFIAFSLFLFLKQKSLPTGGISIINNLTTDRLYIAEEKIPNQLLEELQKRGINPINVRVEVGSDEDDLVFHYTDGKNTRSGFKFSSDKSLILIFVNKNLVQSKEDFLREINRSYITALFYIAEISRSLKPDYKTAGEKSFKAYMELANDLNKLPIYAKN